MNDDQEKENNDKTVFAKLVPKQRHVSVNKQKFKGNGN